jgi:hypothetical protein
MPDPSVVFICTNNVCFISLICIFQLCSEIQSNVGSLNNFFCNILWLLNINISVKLHFLKVHHYCPRHCVTCMLVIPTNTVPYAAHLAVELPTSLLPNGPAKHLPTI